MRVLWVSPNGGYYKNEYKAGTGGWVGALQHEIIQRNTDLELCITFLSNADFEPVKDGRVTYVPVKVEAAKNRIARLVQDLFKNEEKEEQTIAYQINHAIEQYKPDLVHVWGIEGRYASVIPLIKCPFVVHIQGLTSLSIYKHMPNGFSTFDLFKADFPIRWLLNKGSLQRYRDLCKKVDREVSLSKYVINWIGRTEYDHIAANLLHPGSRYFHCEEIMWGGFYGKKWSYHYDGKKIIIASSMHSGWLKGFDILLNTAKVLKQLEIPIEWNVFGIDRKEYRSSYTIKKLHINPEEVGLVLHGSVGRETICEGLLNADVYVHTSYIENSSNAIAEAMMLGVPTVAQFVGGNPTMLKDNSGKLVAANEPYALASAIMDMREKETAEWYSKRALEVSAQRQNPETTIEELMNVYNTILNIK